MAVALGRELAEGFAGLLGLFAGGLGGVAGVGQEARERGIAEVVALGPAGQALQVIFDRAEAVAEAGLLLSLALGFARGGLLGLLRVTGVGGLVALCVQGALVLFEATRGVAQAGEFGADLLDELAFGDDAEAADGGDDVRGEGRRGVGGLGSV